MIGLISRKKFERAIEREKSHAYLRGYQDGRIAAKQDAIFTKYTPNEIRAALGYEPIGDNTELGENINELFISAHKNRLI